LIQANRLEAITTFSKTLTHDLNNPLMIVNGYGEELLESLDENDPRRNEMQEILQAGQRIAKLTNQLLAFTRRQAASPVELELTELLSQAWRRMQESAGPLTEVDPLAKIWVLADPTQAEAGILALASRLRRHVGGLNPIRVECNIANVTERNAREFPTPGAYAEVVMTIDAPRDVRIPSFESLLPGKDSSGPEAARAYAIIREWGGSIWTAPTVSGLALHIYLPLVRFEAIEPAPEPEYVPTPEPVVVPEPQPVAPEIPVEPEAAPLMETVLVVEDEGGIRALVRKILRRQGYEVLEAGAPGEAIRIAREHGQRIHLLVTDMTLPERNGRQLSDELLRMFPGMKVLYVSGYTDDASVYAADLPPGAAFLQKPFTLGSLLKKVREILDAQ
jgi:CheY-like chemotaxis protein